MTSIPRDDAGEPRLNSDLSNVFEVYLFYLAFFRKITAVWYRFNV